MGAPIGRGQRGGVSRLSESGGGPRKLKLLRELRYTANATLVVTKEMKYFRFRHHGIGGTSSGGATSGSRPGGGGGGGGAFALTDYVPNAFDVGKAMTFSPQAAGNAAQRGVSFKGAVICYAASGQGGSLSYTGPALGGTVANSIGDIRRAGGNSENKPLTSSSEYYAAQPGEGGGSGGVGIGGTSTSSGTAGGGAAGDRGLDAMDVEPPIRVLGLAGNGSQYGGGSPLPGANYGGGGSGGSSSAGTEASASSLGIIVVEIYK